MAPAPKESFGSVLRETRLALRPKMSADTLARALSEQGFDYTGAAITGWERGEYAPPRKDVIEAVEAILKVPGRLVPLLGYAEPARSDRVADLEVQFTAIEKRISRLEASVRRLLAEAKPRAR